MKLKIVRIVTASYVVPWHLNNTLIRMPFDFEVSVVGQDVLRNMDIYPNVNFFNISIDRKKSFFSDLFALIALCRFFMSYKPDIVHSIMPKAGLLTAIAGFCCRVPVRIHTFTGQTWASKVGISRYFYYLIDRFINFLNTACLTDSCSQSIFLLENKISAAGQPLPVLSKGSLSGVDISRFDLTKLGNAAIQLRTSLGLEKDDFVFSFIARKTRDKGAVDVLKAFSTVSTITKKSKLLFVGPDEDGEISRLHETNPELFENVIEVGHVSNHEVYLAITDALCLPSYREGFGSIVIDAAAMCVPTIGSRIPGLTDSIADKHTGVLFTAGNLDELVIHMLAFVDNPKMREDMGRSAKERVDEFFTADRLYAALKEFYFERAMENRITNKKLGDLL